MKNIFQSKTFRTIIGLTALTMVIFPIMANAKKADQRVNGSILATNSSVTADISMNITGGLSSTIFASDLQQGTFNYIDSNGLSYALDVLFANIVDNAVWFSGPVITSTDATLVNQWLVAKTTDHGQGATDTLDARFVTAPSIAFNMVVNQNQYLNLYNHYDVVSGNLTIH